MVIKNKGGSERNQEGKTHVGRWTSLGHLGSIKNSTHEKRKAIFVFARRGGFHGRMAVRRNAALGRLSSDHFLLLLGPGLYLRDHFLLKSFKTSVAPTLNVSAGSHVIAS
jgi:hypothetical protein